MASMQVTWSFIILAASVIGVSGVTVVGLVDVMSWIFIGNAPGESGGDGLVRRSGPERVKHMPSDVRHSGSTSAAIKAGK
jgi:hypothetical protein